MVRRINGQSILEYVLVLVVIIAAILAGKSLIQTATEQTLNDSGIAMQHASKYIRDSVPEKK